MTRRFTPLLGIALALVAFAPIAIANEDPAPAPTAHNQIRDLTADEVDRYIATLRDLSGLGVDASAEWEGDASTLQQRAAAVEYGAEAQKVLERYDFDTDSFTDVHWNVLMGYLAGEMEQPSAEMKEAQERQQQILTAMKNQLSPEQYEEAARAMSQLIPNMGAAARAPEGNRELVDARRAELDAIFENARKQTPSE
jgi:hypothetical protein